MTDPSLLKRAHVREADAHQHQQLGDDPGHNLIQARRPDALCSQGLQDDEEAGVGGQDREPREAFLYPS
jgi:hypothetical protein